MREKVSGVMPLGHNAQTHSHGISWYLILKGK